MTDNEIIERYFKARGWKPKKLMGGLIPTGDWLDPDNNLYESLPNILIDFSAFKREVLEPMQGEEYCLEVDGLHGCVSWFDDPFDGPRYDEVIEDNEILRAAVIAATRYLENKGV